MSLPGWIATDGHNVTTEKHVVLWRDPLAKKSLEGDIVSSGLRSFGNVRMPLLFRRNDGSEGRVHIGSSPVTSGFSFSTVRRRELALLCLPDRLLPVVAVARFDYVGFVPCEPATFSATEAIVRNS